VAAVYVSHDLAVVSELAAEVAVMYAGRIAEIGPTPALFGLPQHPYTRGLLAAAPTPERAELLTGIDGQQPRPGHRGAGCAFAARCPQVVDQCRTEAPLLRLVAGREVSCHRAGQRTAGPAIRRAAIAAELAQGPSALSVRALSARYGSATALTDIGLEVPPETCVAVVGESGSGKTTLARCVSGLHENWTGQITFDGAELPAGARRRSRQNLKRIQYVFQNPYTSLNPRKTIGQIVTQPLAQLTDCPPGQRHERVVKVLEDVSLGSGFLSRYPDQLSGGERQRVAIARALVVEPDLLICDEVTSALDVSVQAIIVELLRSIQRDRQLAMIFITHNMALVRSIAQQVVVLRDGQLVEVGDVEQVLERPATEYTKGLIADIPRLTC
jgi:peptide/nickel transport system ATP-binding protein